MDNYPPPSPHLQYGKLLPNEIESFIRVDTSSPVSYLAGELTPVSPGDDLHMTPVCNKKKVSSPTGSVDDSLQKKEDEIPQLDGNESCVSVSSAGSRPRQSDHRAKATRERNKEKRKMSATNATLHLNIQAL